MKIKNFSDRVEKVIETVQVQAIYKSIQNR